jgi:SAM-dependent methyltransferase
MYETIKKSIRKILPGKVLFIIEPFLRSLFYPFYSGKKYHCPVCEKGLRKFIRIPDGDLLCPNCGSISRNRRLWAILMHDYLQAGIAILDFSPSRCLYRKLRKYPSIQYTSSDFAGEFMADKHFDITQIDLPDNSLDLVICYHILEHIEDDFTAIQELYRILKKGANGIIQTPFKEGETYEDVKVISHEDRTKHFGQADHVRIYSVSGLKNRLIRGGFSVEILEYHEEVNNKNGFQPRETVFIVRK